MLLIGLSSLAGSKSSFLSDLAASVDADTVTKVLQLILPSSHVRPIHHPSPRAGLERMTIITVHEGGFRHQRHAGAAREAPQGEP